MRLLANAMASSLKGEFRGWQDGTVFELENGRCWRVIEGDYSTKPWLASPKVTLKPGFLGSWYLHVEGIGVGA